MSQINLKSISGITSITTPTGVDNQLTLHNNNTTEAVKLDVAGNLHFHNHLNITGISTASNFKTGTSNLHSAGLNVAYVDVDDFVDVGSNIKLGNAGIITATGISGGTIAGSTGTFSGDISIVDKIIHTDDTNTAIRFPAADTFSVETAGSERLRIASDGNIGMGGNTNPTNVLHIKTAVINTAVATIESTATNSYPLLRLKNDAREYQLTCHGGLSDAFTIYDGTSAAHRFRIASDGTVTIGDGNNLAADYVATMLIDGGDHTKLTLYGSTTGTGSVTFSDGSGSGATRRAGFIDFTHGANTTTNQFGIGLADVNHVFIRTAGSNRGQLELYGNFNESTNPAIELNDGGDARKVFLTNSSGDLSLLTRNGSQTKGQLKMFESGVFFHAQKDPDSTNVLQTFRTMTYRNQTGSTYTSTSPDQRVMQKGGSGTYDCFEEGNLTITINGGGNDHYQPVAFIPRGYDLDTTSFGGQWAGEMWIHQTGSQNPESYGYDGYNNWATMSFKCKWDCAHWNAKPNGFWVEHYINQGRGNIAKIDASTTQSQFVIYLLPGYYNIRYNCVRGMSVHRAVSNGAALTMRDGGSFVTYNTLAYSSRNTNFDSEIAPGSASFAHCT